MMKLYWVLMALEAFQLRHSVSAYDPTDSLMDADSRQSGYLPNHNMDPAVVAGGSFGRIWTYTTPTGGSEQFYSKPLVFTPDSTGRQVVLAFSEQNRIYSLDAVNGTLVASRDLGLEGERPFEVADLGSCNDISGTIGITGTPVIDPNTETIYFWAKSYIGAVNGYPNGAYRFHAINAVTLQEMPGFPVNIQGTPADNDNTRWFTGGTQLQRPALNLVNGTVFAGFGGHCDQYNFTGWIVGMSASSPKLITAYTTAGGPGSPAEDGTFTGGGGGAGIWMGGSGIASDESGRVFFVTGNGGGGAVNQNQPASGRVVLDTLNECVVNMQIGSTGAVTPQDYFEPYTYIAMDEGDRDLGSGGIQLPDPAVFSGGGVSRMAISIGKNGIAYILNADNLGGYKLGTGGGDAVLQTISMPGGGSVFANSGSYPLEGGYFYVTPVGYPTLAFSLGFTAAGIPEFTLVAQTADLSAGRVGTGPPTITTLNGQAGTAILWIVDPDSGLRAYYAVPQNGNLTKINVPVTPGVSKFQRPAFGNGRYYLSTGNGQILAYGSPVALPMTCTSPLDFGSVTIGMSQTLNVSCTANIPITSFNGFISSKAIYQVSNSSLPTGGLSAGSTFTFPVTFNLENLQLIAGSSSSPQVSPGVQTASIEILTTNGVAGFESTQPVTVTGMSISGTPFISINPLQVDFAPIVVGSAAAATGSSNTFVINNEGQSPMTILGLAWTNGSVSAATTVFRNMTAGTDSRGNPATVFDGNGYFTSNNMPNVGTVIPAGASITVNSEFNSNITGTYFTTLMVYSDGGNAYTIFTGSAASFQVALLQYSNGEGGWNDIPACDVPANGCAYEIDFAPSPGLTQQTIQLRMNNVGGSALTITKSKPLEGTELGATNPNTDFSEGSSIVPGAYDTASVLFSPQAAVINANTVYYSGTWTLNTDDLTWGVHTLNFTGSLYARQVGPLMSSGFSLYKYLGCYQDYVNNFRIEPKEYVNTANSNGLCQNQSLAFGSIFAGTEYQTECWIGTVIPPVSALVADTYCSYSCAGDSTQVCGGAGGYISIYYDSSRYFPANGTIIGATGLGPAIPQAVGGYSYAGCWSDITTARVLSTMTTAGQTITLQTCATFCSAYNIFGVEYADECYCGNTLGSASVIEPDNNCNMPCAGNGSEFCGAGDRLSLYTKVPLLSPSSSSSSSLSSSAATSSASLSVLSSSTSSSISSTGTPNPSFTSLGCYTDNTVTARALNGAATVGSTMTIEVCAAYCAAFIYFGVEYGDECYCGNTIASTSAPATDGRCSMPCAANSAEICGGSYGLNVYQAGISSTSSSQLSTSSQSTTSLSLTSSSQTATSTSGSAATSSSAVPIPSTIGAFTYLHCHSDNTSIRTLQSKYIAKPDMTLEHCAGNCSGYAYFGVEYSQECYCGNTLTFGSYIATDGRCKMPCPGNTIEICGGSNGLTLYQNLTGLVSSSSSVLSSTTSTLSSSSTFVTITSQSSSSVSSTSLSSSSSVLSPSSSSSLISSSSSASSSGSAPSSTSSLLSSRSVSSSLVSSSNSGSALSSTSSSSIISSPSVSSSSASISSSLSSSSSLFSSTLVSSSLTSNSVLSSSTSSIVTSSSSSTSVLSSSTSSIVTSSSSSTSSLATASGTPSPWAYLGCANDTVSARALTGAATANATGMTVEYCQAFCASKQYPIAGLEYGSECYCGYGFSHNSTLGKSGCAQPCSGNSGEICGNGDLLSVYNNTAFTPPKIPASVSATNSSGTFTYNYIGCYTELKNARAISAYEYTSTTLMTVDLCVQTCVGKGYVYAGVEYGSQCFCGNSISADSTVVADSQCQVMLCPGNTKEFCSAGSLLEVYFS